SEKTHQRSQTPEIAAVYYNKANTEYAIIEMMGARHHLTRYSHATRHNSWQAIAEHCIRYGDIL
ncbi:MAG: hypothetical protein LBB42_01160, partial [Coriobacteriales bacterium]|nr:hypothetical protein [Coriobacteriales bacterium]